MLVVESFDDLKKEAVSKENLANGHNALLAGETLLNQKKS